MEMAFCGAGNGSQLFIECHRNFRESHTISKIIVYKQWVILLFTCIKVKGIFRLTVAVGPGWHHLMSFLMENSCRME